ncbi:MAG: hypothetical protein ACI4ML_12145 [Aristaeellaceae bacterium]
MKKVVDTILVLAMLASCIPGLAEDIAQENLSEPGQSKQAASGGEEADPPAAPEKPLSSATQPDSYDAVMNVTMDTGLEGEMVASTGKNENTIHVSAGTLTASGAAITRTSADSDGGDMAYSYGVGAAVLVSGGMAALSDCTVTTDSKGATGLFAYGDGTIHAADTVVDTIQAGSGGVHAAAGSLLRANSLTVHTRGENAGALLVSGGGQLVADGGSYLTEGAFSPAAEVTGEVIARGAQLTAAASEALRMAGASTVRLYDCELSAAMAEGLWAVALDQGVDGESTLAAQLELNGGVLRGSGSGAFAVSGVPCRIVLTRVDIQAGEDGGMLLGVKDSACTLTAITQVLRGDVSLEGETSLALYLTDSSAWTGCVKTAEDAGAGTIQVWVDENSSWVVTEDCRLGSLQCTGAVTDSQGLSVSILGSDGTVYLQGESNVTVTVDTYGDGCDLSGADEGTEWAAYNLD